MISKPIVFGLDIGIASVGWAVLADDHIVDLGVRAFDKAETAKEGESLNLARRMARLMRRRLRRRAWRQIKLARLLRREGLIAETSVETLIPASGQNPLTFTWAGKRLFIAGLSLSSPT